MGNQGRLIFGDAANSDITTANLGNGATVEVSGFGKAEVDNGVTLNFNDGSVFNVSA